MICGGILRVVGLKSVSILQKRDCDDSPLGKDLTVCPLYKAQVTLLPFSACKSGESVNTISAYSASYYIIEGDFSLSNDSHVHTAVV